MGGACFLWSLYNERMADAIQVRYVDPSQVRLTQRDGAAHPDIHIESESPIVGGLIRRVFPLSEPESFLSLLDAEDHEVAILRSTNGLDKDSKAIIALELDRLYFTPKILKLEKLEQDAGMWRFDVDTQRGKISFFVRNWRDSAHEIANGRWQIHSVDGQRFEIEQVDALDTRSQIFLEQLL